MFTLSDIRNSGESQENGEQTYRQAAEQKELKAVGWERPEDILCKRTFSLKESFSWAGGASSGLL